MSGKNTVGKLGTLLLKVVETRDFKSAYCSVNCDVVHRLSPVGKNKLNAKYDESFTMFVLLLSLCSVEHQCNHELFCVCVCVCVSVVL